MSDVAVLWPNGWMHQDETWRADRRRPWPHRVRWGVGDPVALPKKGTEPPIFGPCLLWPNGCMDQHGTWHVEVDLLAGHIVLDGDPAHPRKKAQPPPNFWPMSTVATVTDLNYC